jgi:photosystem II stability/assembly factor-like uncharacterized protein
MKKLLYTFLAVSIIFSACEKEEEEPTNNNSNNNSGNLSNQIIGYFGDELGNVYKTDNEGESWIFQGNCHQGNNQGSTWEGDMVFINSTTGFILGENNNISSSHPILYKTIDSGVNWTYQGDLITADNPEHISFINSSTGYCSDEEGQVFKTNDSGASWVLKGIEPTALECIGLNFVNNSTGFVSNMYGDIYKTMDSGASWIFQGRAGNIVGFPAGQDYQSGAAIHFVNSSTGYYVDRTRKVFKSIDSGANWSLQGPFGQSVQPYPYNHGINFLNETTGFYVNTNGSVYKTTNSASSWSFQGTVPQLSDGIGLVFLD